MLISFTYKVLLMVIQLIYDYHLKERNAKQTEKYQINTEKISMDGAKEAF